MKIPTNPRVAYYSGIARSAISHTLPQMPEAELEKLVSELSTAAERVFIQVTPQGETYALPEHLAGMPFYDYLSSALNIGAVQVGHIANRIYWNSLTDEQRKKELTATRSETRKHSHKFSVMDAVRALNNETFDLTEIRNFGPKRIESLLGALNANDEIVKALPPKYRTQTEQRQ